MRIRCRQRRTGGLGSDRRTKKGWIHPSAAARNCNGPALISHPSASARLRPSLRDRQTAAVAARWQHCNGFHMEQPASHRASVRARSVRKAVTWNQTHGTSSPSLSPASSSLHPSVSGQRQSYDMRFQPPPSHSSSRLLSLLCWCQKNR